MSSENCHPTDIYELTLEFYLKNQTRFDFTMQRAKNGYEEYQC